ncbi:hypothetical protein WH43_17590 [Rheinheimera sp. KL1]|uniref:cell envelope integrity protein TolA n=1 Tax=Rheinheimera sp. KL1 TaxID=1635005 RepID=UPI0006A94F78|nr:cell envelope integrity protein TolA [Rheinheimera sp. KL1]KOO56930.1 hypothetical protein WH43_17590 [Rheinheimera sp. KL1]
MKPIAIFLLIFACMVAGFSGAILYNYFSLNTAQAQLVQLHANAALHDKLINEPYQQERAEVERRQVSPFKMISLDSPDLTERQKYLMLIMSKIRDNWIVDDSMRGKECRVNIQFQSDGALASVSVLDGDYNLCVSGLSAIQKGSPYPMSTDPHVYDSLKNITTTLSPQIR